MRKLLYLLVGVVALLGGCSRCDRHDPEPDLCQNVKPASAAFTGLDAPSFYDKRWIFSYDTDTLLASVILLTAKDTTCSYEWKIGDNTYTTRSFTLHDLPADQPVVVELRVRKKQASPCLDSAKGDFTDTLRRTFVYDSHRQTVISGRFRGFRNGNVNDTATLTFIPFNEVIDGGVLINRTYYYNFNPGKNIYWHWDYPAMALRMGQFGELDQGYTDSSFSMDRYGPIHYIILFGNVIMSKAGIAKFTYTLEQQIAQNGQLLSSDTTHVTFEGQKISNRP